MDEYEENVRKRIRRSLFSEEAQWFFVYVQQSLDHLNEDEVVKMISETLSLPSFTHAREYYLTESKENWCAANLLRKADASEYIIQAKQAKNDKKSLKNSILSMMKYILKRI